MIEVMRGKEKLNATDTLIVDVFLFLILATRLVLKLVTKEHH